MSHPIDYAPAVPWHHRRRWRRVAAAALLIASLVAGMKYCPPAWRRCKVLYWQRQCMAYAVPSDQVVYDDSAVQGGDGSRWSTVSHRPACLDRFDGGASASMGETIVFLHERVTGSGLRRLVVISHPAGWNGFPNTGLAARLSANVYEPATWRHDADPGISGMFSFGCGVTASQPATSPAVRIYAGQIDMADPSRLTVRYTVDGQVRMLDGRLNDAGDDVEWAERVGPTVRPTTRG